MEKELKLFQTYLSSKFNLTVDDVVITRTRGSWELKGGCPGGEGCRHVFRGYIGPCEGGGRLTIYYASTGRDARGRFMSPYRVWDYMLNSANFDMV